MQLNKSNLNQLVFYCWHLCRSTSTVTANYASCEGNHIHCTMPRKYPPIAITIIVKLCNFLYQSHVWTTKLCLSQLNMISKQLKSINYNITCAIYNLLMFMQLYGAFMKVFDMQILYTFCSWLSNLEENQIRYAHSWVALFHRFTYLFCRFKWYPCKYLKPLPWVSQLRSKPCMNHFKKWHAWKYQ